MKDIEESARRVDAAAWIRKPFELDEVSAQVERCISEGGPAA